MKAPRRPAAGFSLIEVVVVVAVLALLAAIAISATSGFLDAARLSRTMADMKVCAGAILAFEENGSGLPAGTHRLSELEPQIRFAAGRRVPTRDGWGGDLYYFGPDVVARGKAALGGDGSVTTFQLHSFGKDGTPDAGTGSPAKENGAAAVPGPPVVTGLWLGYESDLVIEGEIFVQSKW